MDYLTFFTSRTNRAAEGSCYPVNRLHRYVRLFMDIAYIFFRHRERRRGTGCRRRCKRDIHIEGRDTRYNFERNPFARVRVCARIGEATKGRLSFVFVVPPIFFSFFSPCFKRGSLVSRNMHGYARHRIYFARSSRKGESSPGTRVRYTGNRGPFRCVPLHREPDSLRDPQKIVNLFSFLSLTRIMEPCCIHHGKQKIPEVTASIFYSSFPFTSTVYLSRDKRYVSQLNNPGERVATVGPVISSG